MTSTSSTDRIARDAAGQHPPTHQDFRWIEGPAQHSSYARFIETALDISAGVHACLQIIYASELERAANRAADTGQTAAPAIGEQEADRLMRLSIAASGLLHDEAQRRVERFR
ncbi:hypothetical protein [Herbaspirillum sp. RV1423]|uniref:hypothetical protein n=1 Tax=Herbaspirillum sp. RV1423 TaxID=1443993 RepID=UPI0004B6608D|nr:hypothetical protein [Herbaspirillum sp. RV1423]